MQRYSLHEKKWPTLVIVALLVCFQSCVVMPDRTIQEWSTRGASFMEGVKQTHEMRELAHAGKFDEAMAIVRAVSRDLTPKELAGQIEPFVVDGIVRTLALCGDDEQAVAIGDAFIQEMIKAAAADPSTWKRGQNWLRLNWLRVMQMPRISLSGYFRALMDLGEIDKYDAMLLRFRSAQRDLNKIVQNDTFYEGVYNSTREMELAPCEVQRLLLDGKNAEARALAEKARSWEIPIEPGLKSGSASGNLIEWEYRAGTYLFQLELGILAREPALLLEGRRVFEMPPLPSSLSLVGGHKTDPYYRFFYAGYASYLEGNWPAAKRDLESYLATETGLSTRTRDYLWKAYDVLGDCGERLGSVQEAADYFVKATETLEQRRTSLTKDSYKRRFLYNRSRPYERGVYLLATQGKVEEGFALAEKAKSRALIDLMEGKSMGKTRETEAAFKAFQRADIFKSTANLALADIEKPNSTASRSVRDLELTSNALASMDKEFASFVSAQSPKWPEVAKYFEDVVLVEYFLGEESAVVFIGEKGKLRAVPIQIPSAQITKSTGEFRAAIRTGYADVLWKAKDLYDTLLRPVFPDGVPARVVIVPHGPLHLLPFAALHDGKSWLVEQSEISILPSAGVLPYCRAKANRPRKTLFALGNPDLAQPQWALPEAEEEAKTIGRLFGPQAIVLVGKDATKAAFTAKAPQADIIHLACHGVFDPNSPSRSALLLAPFEGDNGRLELPEIMKVSLNASFVVLSACNTGVGEISAGDDVVGLSRGALYAGTPSLMSSLWAVNDAATATLMKKFYTQFLAGKRPPEALRAAQFAILRQGGSGNLPRGIGISAKKPQTISTPYSHPYFWASFQVVGDWR